MSSASRYPDCETWPPGGVKARTRTADEVATPAVRHTARAPVTKVDRSRPSASRTTPRGRPHESARIASVPICMPPTRYCERLLRAPERQPVGEIGQRGKMSAIVFTSNVTNARGHKSSQ